MSFVAVVILLGANRTKFWVDMRLIRENIQFWRRRCFEHVCYVPSRIRLEPESKVSRSRDVFGLTSNKLESLLYAG